MTPRIPLGAKIGRAGYDLERDHVVDELRKSGATGEINSIKGCQRPARKHANHYVTDREIGTASLVVEV
jgi:hypothetical protein